MNHVLLSISGHDRPGIVRDVAGALLTAGANIEDSSMTALRGRFAMMLIVSLPDSVKLAELKAALADLEQRTGLSVQSRPVSEDEVRHEPPAPDHVVTVSGADRPGIVHAVTEALADLGVSIVDMSTRLGEGEAPVYMMALEVAAGAAADAMRQRLRAVSERLGVDVETHPLDSDIL